MWCGDSPLSDSYSSLLGLASSKDALVGECWSNPGEGEGLNALSTRFFNDWELEDAKWLLVGRYVLHVDTKDKVGWDLTGDEAFSVKSLYCMFQQGHATYFSWRIV